MTNSRITSKCSAVAAAMLAGMTASIAYGENIPTNEAQRARQERAEQAAQRTHDILENQHQDWLRRQQDIPHLTAPDTGDLKVPIYKSPPRLE